MKWSNIQDWKPSDSTYLRKKWQKGYALNSLSQTHLVRQYAIDTLQRTEFLYHFVNRS